MVSRFIMPGRTLAGLVFFTLAALATGAAAQPYPNHAIRLIVPWAPGGTSDTPWRIVAPRLSEALGQQVVIENKPGAAGTLGAAVVATAKADGYTLLGTSNVHVLSANVYKNLSYHALDDFIPIGQIAQTCSLLVVHPSLPVSTAREFVAYAKANPGKVDFASTGNGSGQHLFMAQFASMTGISLSHVPYKSVGQAITELLSGQVKAAIPGLSVVSQHVKEGKLKALGVTCAQRSRFMPDVPTLAEAAVPGFDATLREGLMAPKGTPPEVLQRLQVELRKVMETPDIQARIAGTTNEPVFASSEQFSAMLRAEYAKWNKLVTEMAIKPE